MIKICVIGLGYVGLPVALSLSGKFNIIGFDTNKKRIKDLKKNFDSNGEFSKKNFLKKKINFTFKREEIKDCNFYIICLPTPVNKKKIPNLNPLMSSLKILAKKIKKKDIIVLESTVYPGLTKIFSDKLSKLSGLQDNFDFFTCYSPERINPGDKSKKLSKIDKIFATNSSNKDILKKIRSVYKLISKNIIFSKYIPEAEAAKAIENTQRDLNIALYNELLILSDKMNLNFNEVIRLASSKWNFLKFKPGLVGGHCLPVDPYYFAWFAKKLGLNTKIILSGRKTNNEMVKFTKELILKKINKYKLNPKKIRVLLMGLTYKKNVADIRNSLSVKVFQSLKKNFKKFNCYDPLIDKIHKKKYLLIEKKNVKNFDVYIVLTKHDSIKKLIRSKKNKKIIDIFS